MSSNSPFAPGTPGNTVLPTAQPATSLAGSGPSFLTPQGRARLVDEITTLNGKLPEHVKRPNRQARRRMAKTGRSKQWQRLVAQATQAVLREQNDAHREVHNARVQAITEDSAWD